MIAARVTEGEGAARNLREIVVELRQLQATIAEMSEANRIGAVERYRDRLSRLLASVGDAADASIDQARVLQEAGVLAERIDIAEEVERLGVHLETVSTILDQGGLCGKRLDFLAQELLREVNTMASKCRDAELATVTVDAKVLCERFREQVQNVE